jgi:SpoVK/Ycf46/Vps4 family AAA+-type ATPase
VDQSAINGLLAALSVSPENLPLRLTLIRVLGDVDPDQAIGLAADIEPQVLSEDQDKIFIARLYHDAGDHDRCLTFCPSGDQGDLLKVRVLLAQGYRDSAAELYQNVVGRSPQYEDIALARQLGLDAASTEPRKVKLRVIANDDTDATEIIRLIRAPEPVINFASVGGHDAVKKQIYRKIILPFQKPSLFQRFRKKAGGGILLYGPPGCGKTLLARATAGECKARFFNVELSDILDMYIGESEKKLHALFELAREQSPSVLFFDEVEALGGKRQNTREATSSKLNSQFLAEMDGFTQKNSGVLILASTNVPWAIDSAFLRPGRFDRMLFIPPPDREARSEILSILLKDRPVAGDIDIAWLAKQTSGFSGADLKNIVETAVDEAIEESIASGGEVDIGMSHLREALKQARSTTQDWLTTARNYARYANESGQYNEVLDFLSRHGKP